MSNNLEIRILYGVSSVLIGGYMSASSLPILTRIFSLIMIILVGVGIGLLFNYFSKKIRGGK